MFETFDVEGEGSLGYEGVAALVRRQLPDIAPPELRSIMSHIHLLDKDGGCMPSCGRFWRASFFVLSPGQMLRAMAITWICSMSACRRCVGNGNSIQEALCLAGDGRLTCEELWEAVRHAPVGPAARRDLRRVAGLAKTPAEKEMALRRSGSVRHK